MLVEKSGSIHCVNYILECNFLYLNNFYCSWTAGLTTVAGNLLDFQCRYYTAMVEAERFAGSYRFVR